MLYAKMRRHLGYREYLCYFPSNPSLLLEAIRRYVPDVDSYYTVELSPGEYELRIASAFGKDVGIGTIRVLTAYPYWKYKTVRIGLKDFEAPYQLLNKMTFELFLNSRKKQNCLYVDRMQMPHRKYFIVEDKAYWDRMHEQMKFGFVRLYFCGRDLANHYHEVEIRNFTLDELRYEDGMWKVKNKRISKFEFVWRMGITLDLLKVMLSRLDRYKTYWILGI
jgi:hypothetical protein